MESTSISKTTISESTRETACRALLHREFELKDSVGPSVGSESHQVKAAQKELKCVK
jgi:hypothetical protein